MPSYLAPCILQSFSSSHPRPDCEGGLWSDTGSLPSRDLKDRRPATPKDGWEPGTETRGLARLPAVIEQLQVQHAIRTLDAQIERAFEPRLKKAPLVLQHAAARARSLAIAADQAFQFAAAFRAGRHLTSINHFSRG